MTPLKRTIAYFSKSTLAQAELAKARNPDGITRLGIAGLIKIGKTRFASHYSSAMALQRCLPFIQDLVSSKVIKIKASARSDLLCPAAIQRSAGR